MQLYFTTILLFHCILIQINAALVSINGKITTFKNPTNPTVLNSSLK